MFSDTQPMLQWLQHYKQNGSYMNSDDEPYVHILQVSANFYSQYSQVPLKRPPLGPTKNVLIFNLFLKSEILKQ